MSRKRIEVECDSQQIRCRRTSSLVTDPLPTPCISILQSSNNLSSKTTWRRHKVVGVINKTELFTTLRSNETTEEKVTGPRSSTTTSVTDIFLFSNVRERTVVRSRSVLRERMEVNGRFPFKGGGEGDYPPSQSSQSYPRKE